MSDRIHNEGLCSRLMSIKDAAALVGDGWNISFSGFTDAGYPKEFPKTLTTRIEAAHEKGGGFRIGMWAGVSTAPELSGVLIRTRGIASHAPYQSDPEMHTAINKGITDYYDVHFSHVGLQVSQGFLSPLYLTIVEATAITEDGDVVPSFSVGLSRTYLEQADKVIIEVNSWQSEDLFGMHDVYYPIGALLPNRGTLPITSTSDQAGDKVLKVDADKMVAVVETSAADRNASSKPLDDDFRAIVDYLPDFLTNEVRHGRLPGNLLSLQLGVGNIANAVPAGLLEGPFENLTSYAEVIQDGTVDLIDADEVTVASGTAFSSFPEAAERMNEKARSYRNHTILRPMDASNRPEVIRHMGVAACNSMIEADIYDSVSSTHIMGSRTINGIDGFGDFTCNSYFPSFATPSTAKGGAVSAIIPMVSHVDHTEHGVDVITTEQGLADLRGLAPRQRAQAIIKNCAHPGLKEPLREYMKLAVTKANGQQTPHDLTTAFSWHVHSLGTGSMK